MTATRIHDQLKPETLEAMIREKRGWLERFSTGRDKRPDTQLNFERERLRILAEAVADHGSGGSYERFLTR